MKKQRQSNVALCSEDNIDQYCRAVASLLSNLSNNNTKTVKKQLDESQMRDVDDEYEPFDVVPEDQDFM
ncbi:hypothetical protein H8E50_01310 [bacterium]|nr:hypothetical protein [bacterium]